MHAQWMVRDRVCERVCVLRRDLGVYKTTGEKRERGHFPRRGLIVDEFVVVVVIRHLKDREEEEILQMDDKKRVTCITHNKGRHCLFAPP